MKSHSQRWVLRDTLITPADISLGSFIPNVTDLDLDILNDTISLSEHELSVSCTDNVTLSVCSHQASRLEVLIARLVGASSLSAQSTETHVLAKQSYLYTLRQPMQVFERACTSPAVRAWIQHQIEEGNRHRIYFVVGIRTVVDSTASVDRNDQVKRTVDISVPDNILDSGLQALGGGVRVGGNRERGSGVSHQYSATGEQILALRLKRVRLRFFEPGDVDRARLERNTAWIMVSGNRTIQNDESEGVEADLDDAGETSETETMEVNFLGDDEEKEEDEDEDDDC
ncbi:hypothetical protein AtubIFM55763_007752 [Aspergillus tubingensis]|nr:hypothetical protein AtubIFM54640_001855 [Aspergillus tubingensis]GLA76186.1 hypothetical protein AtubIFM55763_007752 [Aspergillus tubingensis]